MKSTIIMIAMLVSSNISAASLAKESPFCITANLMDQLLSALISDPMDMNAIGYLVENGCSLTNDEYQITLLEDMNNSISHVRMYKGSTSQEAWVFTNNIID